MTTPRIDEVEIIEHYSNNKLTTLFIQGEEWVRKSALTQAHQAGIDEAVEKIKKLEKYRGIVTHNDNFLNGKVEGYNQALDDTIKALQDNK